MNNILEVQNLCKKYKTFSLKSETFSVPQGYICGFIGPNGAGKTTTLKLILGITKPDSGAIKLFGNSEPVNLNSDSNEKIGIVMDSPMYVDDWKIKDVEKAVSMFYAQWNTAKFQTYLRNFNLDKQKKVKDLSRGMKVKLQIAVALSHNAELLILDEPTSGLDPVARDEICDLLREFITDERKSVFFSTHITADLEKTADYIVFIMNGKIVFTGTKDELLEKYIRVAGGLKDITTEQKNLLIGYREHGTGFEGMAETSCKNKFSSKILIEKITLDEIIVFMNKNEKN